VRMVSVFQSTPLHEGRPIPRESLDWIKRVSIHAPARGATRRLPAVPRGLHRFNPRPCTRGDLRNIYAAEDAMGKEARHASE